MLGVVIGTIVVLPVLVGLLYLPSYVLVAIAEGGIPTGGER